ncbi:cold-shock protein [Rhizobium leguminosarum]|nr:cold shock domain-containing protein [Rhizobium leguminosarum]
MATGTVTWFNATRVGFIRSDDGGDGIFVHNRGGAA